MACAWRLRSTDDLYVKNKSAWTRSRPSCSNGELQGRIGKRCGAGCFIVEEKHNGEGGGMEQCVADYICLAYPRTRSILKVMKSKLGRGEEKSAPHGIAVGMHKAYA